MIQSVSQQAAPQTMILLPQTEWEGLKQELKKLAELVANKNKAEALDEWIESGQARKMLGVSQKTWQTYRDNRVIPFSQFGRKIYVKKADLEAFMQSHYITAKE
jgi:ABC-type hemin transport system substrate-binding protein